MDSIQGPTMDLGVPVMHVQTQHGAPSKGPPFQNQNAAAKKSNSSAKNTPQKNDTVARKGPMNSDRVTNKVPQNIDGVSKKAAYSSDGISKTAPHNSGGVSTQAAQQAHSASGNPQKSNMSRGEPNTPQNHEAVHMHHGNKSSRNRKPRWRDSKNREKVETNSNCKVTVSGYPEYTQPQDLKHLFTQFGTVRVQDKNIESATLAFSNIAEAHEALQSSNKIALYAEILTVKPYVPSEQKQHTQKRSFVRSQQKSVIVPPSSLNLSGDFLQQLDAVLSAVRLSLQEVTALGQLYSDLENALQAQWPGCKAIPFGSIPTGLGIKTSDADCFMLIPPQFRQQRSLFVNKTRRLLQMYPTIFSEILAIPRANTPIVKFFHIPTETNCDVSFKTPLGTRNSALVCFLLSVDPRLIPIAVLIKYWAKVHGLSGTGKLTNYALTMMVIAYLQQPPLSILPSVAWLQSDPETANLVDNWNTGFMNNHELLPRSTNTSSISELIGGFFQYYSTFNFAEMIVCPYLGVPIPKTTFKNTQNLPPEFEMYKRNLDEHLAPQLRFLTPMVIQDPFEQCHNVASSITTSLSEKIRAFINFAANAYEAEKVNNSQNFLPKILLEKPKYEEKKLPPVYKIKLFSKLLSDLNDPNWKQIVKDIVFDVFENMCKLKLTKLEEKDNEIKKTEPTKKHKEKYTTTITKPVWTRKKFSRVCENLNLGLVEKQSRITEEIIRSVPEDLNLKIEVAIIYYPLTKSASATIRMLEGELESYKEFGRFFFVYIQGWFRDLLKPYLKEPAEVPSTTNQTTTQNAYQTTTQNANAGQTVPDTDDDDDDDAVDESQLKTDELSDSNGTAQNNESDDNSDS